ncbi:hypothetical protein KQI84_08400 [bacterium]|nr:hypothetical protein [bacterium]
MMMRRAMCNRIIGGFGGWGAVLLMLALVVPAAAQRAVLNEVVIDSGSGEDSEYVELFTMRPSQDLGGLSIITISAQGADTGRVLGRMDLPRGARSNSNQLFLLANQRTINLYGITPDLTFQSTDFSFPDQAQTVLLVSTDNAPRPGTVLRGTEQFLIYDGVAIVQNPGFDQPMFGVPAIGPDGTRVPAGVYRILDGRDKNLPSDFYMSSPSGPGNPENTPGVLNASGYTFPAARPQPTPVVGTARGAQSTGIAWDRDPKFTFQRSLRARQGFVILFSATNNMDATRLFQELNTSQDFAKSVRDNKVNLTYVDLAHDAQGSEWARKCKVFRVPTMVAYDSSGNEVNRIVFDVTRSASPQAVDFLSTTY